MTKRMVIMLILVGLLFGGIFGFKAFKGKMMQKYMKAKGAPVQTISTITAAEQEWQSRFEAVGTLKARRGADLAPEVSGIVTRIDFQSGAEVKGGDLLLELNAETERAKLKALQAFAALARQNYLRDQKQFEAQAISQAVLDADQAALRSTEAQVAEQQAALNKKIIRAPFAGKLGIRVVDLGQYLSPGTKIVTLQALDPILVDFFLPQKFIGQLSLGKKVAIKVDAFPGQVFTGEISAFNPKVDTATRNLEVQATISNPKHLLLPGMFAVAQIDNGQPQRHITLPQTAITYNPYGNVVFLVQNEGQGPKGEPKLVAKQKFVITGDTRGDQVAVLEGVKTGDVVVTSGQIKLHNGSPVTINNAVQQTNDVAPKPQEE